MKNFLSALWQLPQTLLGAIIIILFHGVRLDEYDTKTTNLLSVNSVRYGNVYIIKIRRKYDTARHPVLVSLGRFVIIEESYLLSLMPSLNSSAETQRVFLRLIKHEQGHCRQSVMLGPLYLVVVGIPSATLNALTRLQSSRFDLLKRIGHEAYWNYYKMYPERWADRLGGVVDRTMVMEVNTDITKNEEGLMPCKLCGNYPKSGLNCVWQWVYYCNDKSHKLVHTDSYSSKMNTQEQAKEQWNNGEYGE